MEEVIFGRDVIVKNTDGSLAVVRNARKDVYPSNMSVSDFANAAQDYGLENESVSDVLEFIKVATSQNSRQVAMCGHCQNRKTETCPFPHMCSLCMPPCLSFKDKE